MKTKTIGIGRFLKDMVKKSGKNQKQVADDLCISPSVLSKWVMGHNMNGIYERIDDITRVCGMSEVERKKLEELCSASQGAKGLPSEYMVFYDLVMLPEDARKRVIRAVKAYATVKEG